MCEEELNCYITKLFLENDTSNILGKNIDEYEKQCEKYGIKIFTFQSENMILIKKINPYTKDYHDKIIFNTITKKPIVSFSNNIIFDNTANELISKINWNKMEIIEYNFNSLHVSVFNENNTWYLAFGDEIVNLDNLENIYVKIFMDLLAEEDIINWKKSTIVYHLLLTHPTLSQVTQHDTKSITLLWTCDKYINIIESDQIAFNKKLKYFSCLDELQMSLEIECGSDVANKSLSFGGYFLKIPFNLSNKMQYLCCVLRSNLYKYILSIVPKNNNKYINYLELYQKNELSDIIMYVHKYPNDVIRRINMAIRTLSKEILNIYHLTRKQQNFILYKSLTKRYKKVLYELHKIYVTQKHIEISANSIELLKEKKSISVDVVYDYLKSINVIDLIQIFKNRNEIIQNLEKQNYKMDHIFILNDVYIITQIELMFNS